MDRFKIDMEEAEFFIAIRGEKKMEQETIKILCTDCEKRNVCMYKDEFELIVAQTEQIKKALIHKIIVECMEYRKTKPIQRGKN